MPRTKLGDKYSKPKIPPPNYLRELLKTYRKAYGLSNDEIAVKLGVCRKTACNYINQPAEKWSVGELAKYCEVLHIPVSEALEAAGKSLRS